MKHAASFSATLGLGLGLALTPALGAEADDTSKAIDAYRAALQDGNPAELYQGTGEDLWKRPAGPNNVSLEKCDLGLGAGVVKGAYAALPRYFKDSGKVEDAESRVLTCMKTLQGVDIQAYIDAPFGSPKKEELNAIATYVSGESQGMPVTVSLSGPEEQRMYNLGRRMFYYRAGPYDFSCATCHGQAGARIRLQDLADLSTPKGAASAWTTWPAYRVSTGSVWGMQNRLNDCMRQQRLPEPKYASEVTIALETFLAVTAKGAAMQTPGIKR